MDTGCFNIIFVHCHCCMVKAGLHHVQGWSQSKMAMPSLGALLSLQATLWQVFCGSTPRFTTACHDLQKHCQRCTVRNDLYRSCWVHEERQEPITVVCHQRVSVRKHFLWHHAFGISRDCQEPHSILLETAEALGFPLRTQWNRCWVPQKGQPGDETGLQGAQDPCVGPVSFRGQMSTRLFAPNIF